ncbi:SDR family oxidoreductase [Reichenbachiella versicolor]|uniref:SDR family oxidoreductase n=1 Tax=Reichenbachiella versicolor TaxID=1821036 RepID=UPI000D6E4AC3|nr:SDR family oxidoreductase [Reichenbachiella versicolor]
MKIVLKGKKALVCGSTSGIGLATARQLAQLGASIVLFARNEEKLKVTVESLPTPEEQLHEYLVADFSNPSSVEEAIDDYLSSNDAPTILVNNTGGPAPGKLIEEDYQKFNDTFQAHIQNNHYLAKALVPKMKEVSFGRIINIISTSVYMPIPGLGVSNTTRAAVAGWAKTLSIELGSFGITVNNVLPGLTATARLDSIIESTMADSGQPRSVVETDMNKATPAGRFGKPEEVGAVAAFLATDSAAYVNGVSIPVDGGRSGCI